MATSRRITSRIPQMADTELLILNALQQGEQFPLRLADRSEGLVKRGTVYVTLQRMEKKGLVESRLEPVIRGATGRPRRWYQPSAYGRQVFAAWQLAERAFEAPATRLMGGPSLHPL
jgi:PadR family transcriptional regulator